MYKRIKDRLESIAYAGLKPTTPGAPREAEAEAKSGLRARFDRVLAGPATSDPLYLTNRTLWQKLRPMIVISIPIIVLMGGIALGLSNYFGLNKPYQPPPASMSNAEIAKQMLPVLNKLHFDAQHDVEIIDVIIPPGSMHVQGVAKNQTDHPISHVRVEFDLTDRAGSRQGAVSLDLENLPAKGSKPFSFAIPQKLASFAIVRPIELDKAQ